MRGGKVHLTLKITNRNNLNSILDKLLTRFRVVVLWLTKLTLTPA